MTNEQIESLFEELIAMVHESRMEARALRQMLADHKVISEVELEHRIKDVTMEELVEMKAETYRRAWEKGWKDSPMH